MINIDRKKKMIKERDWKEIVRFANGVLKNTAENLKKEISSDINERGQGVQKRIAKSIFCLDLLKIIYGCAEIEKMQKEFEEEFLPDSDDSDIISENGNCCISGPRIFFKGGLVEKSKKLDRHLTGDSMITINLNGLPEEVKSKIDEKLGFKKNKIDKAIKVLTSAASNLIMNFSDEEESPYEEFKKLNREFKKIIEAIEILKKE